MFVSIYIQNSFVDYIVLVPATETVKPADVLNKIDASVEKSVNAAEVKNVVAGATPTLDNGKKHSDAKVVAAKKPTEPDAESVAPQIDGAKKSFLAIVSFCSCKF